MVSKSKIPIVPARPFIEFASTRAYLSLERGDDKGKTNLYQLRLGIVRLDNLILPRRSLPL
jgi:hypothetical protein